MKTEVAQKSILIVDDDETLRGALVFDFKRRGYKVYSAQDGQEAFEIVKTEVIDVVVTDIRMPKKSGVDLLDRIKEIKTRIPVVVFLTGYADLTLEDAYDKGACAVMSKPFDRKALVACVERALQGYSEKFSQSIEAPQSKHKVEWNVQGNPTSHESKLIGIGQGGMFISMQGTLPREGNVISFKIEHFSKDLVLLEGQGIVRWVRTTALADSPSGLGIEFIFLDEKCRANVIEFLEGLQVKAYIPKAA